MGPIAVGDIQITIDVQQRLVQGTRNGSSVWSYRADGRIHTEPTVADDLIYIVSTNGTITALEGATGTPRWRFLAARNNDKVVVNGQLESRWPVYNTVLHNGHLYAVAGRHVELDGGLVSWALDPTTGAIQGRAELIQPLTSVEPAEKYPNHEQALAT